MSYMQTATMGITPTELVSHSIDGPYGRDAYANQLWQTYQLLGQRVDTARAQLAHHQAQQEVLQAQSAAAVHAQAVIQGQGPSRPDLSTTTSPQRTPYLSGSPQLQNAVPALPTSYVIYLKIVDRFALAMEALTGLSGYLISYQSLITITADRDSSTAGNATHDLSKWRPKQRRSLSIPTSSWNQ
jgi:hypothetical protein